MPNLFAVSQMIGAHTQNRQLQGKGHWNGNRTIAYLRLPINDP